MKKRILLGLLGALLMTILLVTSANAQTFVASFGVEHSWGVPHRVSHFIDNHYYDYNWVHTRRVSHHGNVDFEVILQRGDVFIEISIDPFGNVFKSVRRDYYPLNEHVCGGHCGYHTNYYQAYYSGCNSHSHHGHNHVNYYHHPKGHAYGYYKNKGHGNGHNNGNYYKGNKHNYKSDRKSSESNYPTRRSEYYKEYNSNRGNHGRTSGGSYNSRGKSSSSSNSNRTASRTTTATRRSR